MIITKDKYKEILEIQGVTYTEGSAWFQTSLERINQALSLANVVGRSEQLMQSCSVCGTTKHPIMGAHCKASNCPHEH